MSKPSVVSPLRQPEPPKRYSKPMPMEGENGVFTQSWFPICMSRDVAPGKVVGRNFLDGRVLVYRGEDGVAQVLSAYCPHVGADVSMGWVTENRVVCPFHAWEFGRDGFACKTGVGDPVPQNTGLFRFPTVERWGLSFAFNGLEPLWDLPDFYDQNGPVVGRRFRDDELLITTERVFTMNVDPWIVCANTLDQNHIITLHHISPDGLPGVEEIRWNPYDVTYEFTARHWQNEEAKYSVGIYGTSFFYQSSTFDGRWFGILAPMGMPRPGVTEPYFVLAVQKGDGSPQALKEAEAIRDYALDVERRFVWQDNSVLTVMHFRQGTLTRSDRPLAKFLDHIRDYPRAHPSADFLR
jgi:phenylpropionate dioxygenase-like ring-hydroxylating dioxygenase large terminal subunit